MKNKEEIIKDFLENTDKITECNVIQPVKDVTDEDSGGWREYTSYGIRIFIFVIDYNPKRISKEEINEK